MKKLSKVGIAIISFTALLISMSAPAFSHVTVDPKTASNGGYQTFTFKVPNEDDVQSTNKIEIEIPADAKIEHGSVMPVLGWTYEIQKIQSTDKAEDGTPIEFISKVTFQGGEVKPGEFQEFKISLGRLPEDLDTLNFKAVQTYTGGKVSKWIEESIDGEEVENPAPVVALLVGDDDHSTSSSHSGDAEVKEDSKDEASDNEIVVYIALGISILAIAIGATALLKKK